MSRLNYKHGVTPLLSSNECDSGTMRHTQNHLLPMRHSTGTITIKQVCICVLRQMRHMFDKTVPLCGAVSLGCSKGAFWSM